ncbi:MAG: nuclear transport factor 2 family protein [Vicinamibacterales bacterium]
MFRWSPANASVWHLVEALNHAWIVGPLDALESIYHESVVVLDGDGREVARGRHDAVGLYRAFLADVEIQDFRPYDPAIHVDVGGGTGIVQYGFDLRYRRGGQDVHETGRDLLVLTYANNGWQVFWRQSSRQPAEPGS